MNTHLIRQSLHFALQIDMGLLVLGIGRLERLQVFLHRLHRTLGGLHLFLYDPQPFLCHLMLAMRRIARLTKGGRRRMQLVFQGLRGSLRLVRWMHSSSTFLHGSIDRRRS